MSKLYVFGIGGTGSRVLKSLTMLLASGIQCQDEIVPIIIDPDAANADLTKTDALIKKYNSIREKLQLDGNKNQFFRANISNAQQIQLANTASQKFDNFIGFGTMPQQDQALMKMLFSDKNLNADMSIGFTGNPNMGSVVLNQFESSNAMKAFANNFKQGDKIFIISSIFGGTGASGFPLLLKTLRSTNTLPNYGFLNDALIGAITIMPYFSLQQNNNSPINANTFLMKTKAALSYYLSTLGNANIDSLYYIGDDMSKAYQNVQGGAQQLNDAHFVELVSALSILDFSANGKHNGTTDYKEFGLIDNPSNQLSFADLHSSTKKQLEKPLTQIFLFYKYLKLIRESHYKHQPWAIDNGFDSNFFDGDFYKTLEVFLSDYNPDPKQRPASFYAFIKEMAGNTRCFMPFYDGEELRKVVKGVNPKKVLYPFFTNNNALMDNFLNKCNHKIKGKNKEQRFVELFYLATEEYVGKIFKFN